LQKLSTFGFWGQKSSPETKAMALVINPHGGEHLETVYQHQPTFQKSNCLRCVNADTRRIRKNTALFHLFSHLFQFSVLTEINGEPTIVAQKHSATGEEWRATPSNGSVGCAREQRKPTFGQKN
jgi:hypothetical protein